LRKYRRTFKLGDPQQPGTKEEHLPLVVRHWQNMVRARGCQGAGRRVPPPCALGRLAAGRRSLLAQTVDEDETLLAFVFALRKQATAKKK